MSCDQSFLRSLRCRYWDKARARMWVHMPFSGQQSQSRTSVQDQGPANPQPTSTAASAGCGLVAPGCVLLGVVITMTLGLLLENSRWSDSARVPANVGELVVQSSACKSVDVGTQVVHCCAQTASERVKVTIDNSTSGNRNPFGALPHVRAWQHQQQDAVEWVAAPRPVLPGHLHALVTGGAGYIGSHAALRLLEDGHAVTVVDNLSRGNRGAITALQAVAKPGQFRFVKLDLGDPTRVLSLFRASAFDVVVHFAAVAYVAESYADPLLYYNNVTANTRHVLEGMRAAGVHSIVYSSTCAVYGNPKTMPVTESTPQRPVSPYGSAKLTSEHMIREYTAANPKFAAIILRYFNVIGSDPRGRIGEGPTGEMAAKHGRISGACFRAALSKHPTMAITGTDHKTADGTCVRDYIHVVDLVDAHVLGLKAFERGKARIFNVGVGKGHSVREFVDACITVTGVNMTVVERERRDGDAAIIFSDPAKVKRDLGWKPRYTDLRFALKTSWDWASQHPHGYAQ